MLDDQRWFVVRNMVTVLGGIGSPTGIKALLRLSQDPDSRIRKEVARVISKPASIGDPDAEHHLIALLEDPDIAVQRTAISAAARSRSPRLLDALWSTFWRVRIWSKAWEMKVVALKAIGRMGLPEAAPRMAAVAEKRCLLWRKKWRAVQTAAAQALCGLEALTAEDRAVQGECEGSKEHQGEALTQSAEAERDSEEDI
jgi:HEAT repeat protein